MERGRKGVNRKEIKNRKKEKRKKKKNMGKGNLDISHLNPTGEAILLNVFQNSFSFIREAAPPEELELEPFLKEPELCQTGPIHFRVSS